MKNFHARIKLVTFLFMGVCCVVAAKLYDLQVCKNDFFEQLVKQKTSRVRTSRPLRGDILDRNGNILATTLVVQTCCVESAKAKNNLNLNAFSEAVGVPKATLIAKLNSGRKFITIRRKMLPAAAQKVNKKEFTDRGVYFEDEHMRYYPENELANYVVGLVSNDNKGQSGIEYSYNNFLLGRAHRNTETVDRLGRVIDERPVSNETKSVMLTIDSNIQHIVENEINKVYTETQASSVIGIVQDPNTGDILALAVAPSYNPNKTRNLAMLKNPAVSNSYEPGSVFKIVTAAAALEHIPGIKKEIIFCENGEYKLYKDIKIRDHDKQSWLSIERVIAYSSNIGCAKLARRVGPQKFWQVARAFGFGVPTGIDLPGETGGKFLSPEKWSGISCEMISFGQELSATPIQIVNSFSVVANGGFLLKPKIVKKEICGDNAKVKEEERQRRVISQKTVADITDFLEAVVNYGTGAQAKVQGIRVAGKTGTAQKFDRELNRYSSKRYTASFAGFLPADNPKATILVMVDEPKGDYWASSVAAPVFSRIASNIAGYLNINSGRTDIVLK